MRNLSLVLLLVICNSVYSQLLSPTELIDSGISMHNDEKYDEAIRLYQQVNENDKKYPLALYEIALSFIEKKEYDSAMRYIDIYKKNNFTNDIEGLSILNGICYDNTKQYDKTIEVYDEVLKKYPNSARILHHKGISYYLKEDKAKAVEFFKEAYYQKSDYCKNLNAMTQLAREGGMIVESMLTALHSAYYSIQRGGNQGVLVALEQIVSEKPIEQTKEYSFSTEGDDFKSIDEMIKSQVALQSKYKIDCELDFPFVKQTHLLLTMLQDYEPGNGYFDTYFVPYYKKLMDEGKFNAFIYTLLVDNSSEKVQPIIKKHIEEIKEFVAWSELAMLEVNVREFEVDGKKIKKTCFFEPELKICGDMIDGKQEGVWYMFYPNGNLARYGNTQKGKTEGQWKYYDEDGTMNSFINFKANKKQGEYNDFYTESGKLKEKGNFDNDSLSGVIQAYYPNGVLGRSSIYKDNKLEGKMISYSIDGKKSAEREYSNNELNGESKDYFVDGEKVETINNNKNGYIDGNYKEYFRTLALYKDIDYEEGDFSGKYKEYYPNGNIYKEGIYNKNKLTDVVSYFKNGKKQNSNEVSKDEVKVRLEYDYDGDLFGKFYYKDDEVDKIEFFDKKGNITETKKIGKNDVFEDKWYYTGKIASTGRYKNYLRDGLWTYYNINGALKREYNYKDGKQEGIQKEYDEYGNLTTQYEMKDDELHGEYKILNEDGSISEIGLYRNGEKNGLWKEYYVDGTMSEESYYYDGELQGKTKSYDAHGKLCNDYIYDEDIFKEMINYDVDGNIVKRYDLFEPRFTEYPNSKMELSKMINERVNGKYEGKVLFELEPGIMIREGNYVSSNKDGLFKIYYENGNLQRSSNYLLGDLQGPDTFFYINGTPYIISDYILGKENGTTTKYYSNGSVMYTRQYVLDELDGPTIFYSVGGEEIMKQEYKMGFLYYILVKNSSGEYGDTIYNKGQDIEVVSYHKNGKKAIFETLHKGKSMKYQIFNEDEKPMYEYDSDKYGNMTYRNMYYTNGNKLSEQKYKLGALDGDTKYYNEDGTLALVVPYMNNQLEGTLNIYKDNQIDKQYVYRLNFVYEKIK